MFKECGKTFLKSNGLNCHGKWFCNDDCAEKDPDTKKIIDMLAKGPPTYDTRERELQIIKENEEEI
jgi:ubiquitin C-terminal hydrolase